MIKSRSGRGQTALPGGPQIPVWTLCPRGAGGVSSLLDRGAPDFPPETTACKEGERDFTVQMPETRLSPEVEGDESW